MPIRGDRLRWPPRPGKRSGAARPSEYAASLVQRSATGDAKQELQQPDKSRASQLIGEAVSPREPSPSHDDDAGQ